MIIYIVTVSIILVGGLVCNTSKGKKSKLIYSIICGGLLLCVAGFRNPYMGTNDNVVTYIPNFEKIHYMTFSKVYIFFSKLDTEVTFYIITKVITIFTSNINIYFTICEIPLIYAFIKIVYKYSKIPMLSFIIFFSALYFLWSLIIIRQAVALGFILISFDKLCEKKYVKFVIYVLIASLFHRTALIFFMVLPLTRLNFNNKKIISFILVLIIFALFGNKMVDVFLGFFSNTRHFSSYIDRRESFGNEGQFFQFFLYTILTVMAFLFSKKEFKQENRLLFNICFNGCLVCSLAPIFAEFFRMGIYFTIFLTILVPNTISELKVQLTKHTFVFILIILMLLVAYSTFNSLGYIPYYFYWQS